MDLLGYLKPHDFEYPEGQKRQATRALEWFLAKIDMIYGFLLILPVTLVGSAMTGTLYAHLLMILPEHVWGTLFLLKGGFHALALWVNGRAFWTPWIRSVSCAISASFWAVIFGVLISGDTHLDFLLVFAGVSAYSYAMAMRSCGYDAALYWRRRHAGKSN